MASQLGEDSIRWLKFLKTMPNGLMEQYNVQFIAALFPQYCF
jgi:hypothetical protein